MRHRVLFISLLTIFSALLAVFTVRPAAAQSNAWTAEYFNNPSLAGAPVLVRTESTLTQEWGLGSPGAGVPVDYFSARWTTTTFLNAGTYQISLRVDDGIRIYVDGNLVMNNWAPSPGNFYQASVSLAAGNHSFVVEYFEATGAGFLVYNFDQLSPVPPPGAPQARVTAQFLNVRSLPGVQGAILDVISLNQTYPVIGRNLDNTWLQLNLNGVPGWVNARFVAASNTAIVPITDGQGGTIPTPVPPPVVISTATVTAYRLNVRDMPNPFTGNVLTKVSQNEVYPVVGRNADSSWVQINVNGLIGWVRSTWVVASNISVVPVTSNTSNPAQPPVVQPVTATVRAYFLNVRSLPYYPAPRLTMIVFGQAYPVVGRNADSSWTQINVGGTIGWVRSSWVTVTPSFANVPVTG